MFFIMTSGQKDKKLEFDQVVVCPNCGKYGHLNVYMVYSYFSLFFIPLFKWNKRYFAKMGCCNAVCELAQELGKQIEKEIVTSVDENILHFQKYNRILECRYCGYKTEEDFDYCPKCGKKL